MSLFQVVIQWRCLVKPSFRVVWSRGSREALVSSLSGKVNMRLNDAAGRILAAIHRGDKSLQELREQHPSFIRSCEELGLLGGNEHTWSFTELEHDYPLKRIQVELTRFCNLKCPYCYSSCGPKQKAALPRERILQLLEEAKSLGCLWLDITGGEPLAHRDWRDILGRAVELGLVTSLHSNGTLMSEDVVQDIVSLGVHHVQVSLDSHVPEVHDASRGKRGAFERSIRGIESCRKASMAVTVSMVAHQGNKDHYIDAVRYFRAQLGVRVLMDRVIRAGGELSAGVGLSTAEYFELISTLIKEGVGESKVCDSFVTNDFKVEPYCGVAHSFVYITAEGEMALCPTMTSRDNPIFEGPNISAISLRDAWLGSKYFTKYRGLNCRNTSRCPTAKQCGGGCRSNAYIETGELDAPDYLSCNLNKNSTGDFVDFASLYTKRQEVGSRGAVIL